VVEHLHRSGQITGMVGDGLKTTSGPCGADVAFAIGHRNRCGDRRRDITLVSGDLPASPTAIELSGRAAMANIRQNLFSAFVTTRGISLAAAMLFPFTAGCEPDDRRAAMASALSPVVMNACACAVPAPRRRAEGSWRRCSRSRSCWLCFAQGSRMDFLHGWFDARPPNRLVSPFYFRFL